MEAEPTTTEASPRSRASEVLLFASNFLRNPGMLGSIVPSSRSLVNKVLAPIDWSRARVIVEYGPGVGTFTAEMLRRMRSDARLIAIETNLEFVQFIGTSFSDHRLRIEHDSAQNVARVLRRLGIARASCIVSGIPLGSMPKELQTEIAVASRDLLEPGGPLCVYQFTSRVLPVLRRTFPQVRRSVEVRNFPPAQLFVCEGAHAAAAASR
jgi:phospholipid N-methyltransferase